MNHNTIKNVMRIFIVALAIIGLVFYAYAVPTLGKSISLAYPEYAHCYYPWLVFISVTAIPPYIVLIGLWKLSTLVGNDDVFTQKAAKHFKNISLLAAGDIVFFFIVNIIFLFTGMNHPGILIGSVILSIIGAGFSFCALVASQYISQASVLKEENDLTI